MYRQWKIRFVVTVEGEIFIGFTLKPTTDQKKKYPNQEERARKLGLDSLYHLSYAELMEAALGNPVSKRIQNPATLFEEHGYCGACFTGRYPISIEGVIKKIS